MTRHIMVVLGILWVFTFAVHAQNTGLESVKWQKGPSIGNLGTVAEVHIPAGYVFAGAEDTRKLMEATQNPLSGQELGFIGPEGLDWFAVFEFDDVGYIRDDEKNSLDADAMLKSIRRATEESNKERKKHGWPSLSITGWAQPPHYDESTHNLEWAINGKSEETSVINYNVRLLGRKGVMSVTLVADPNTFSTILPNFKTLISGFTFKGGEKYSEYIQGDKVAEYGLTALVVGGATAAAVKTGLFKWIWKFLVLGFMALVAFLKKLFGRNKANQVTNE